MKIPYLSDEVVSLDPFTWEDLEAHLAGEDEEQARRFGWYPNRSTRSNVRDAFTHWAEEWERDGPVRAFALRDKASRELLGGCELRLRGAGVAEISYWTFPLHRSKGFASRAVRLLTDFAFGRLGTERIEAQIEPDNLASRRVVEAAGFIEQGILPKADQTVTGEWRDMVLYVLTSPPSGAQRES